MSVDAFLTLNRQNPWPLVATVTCLVGSVAFLLLLWRNWVFVWAVARKIIIEALHRRIVLVLLVFFIVLMLSLPFMLKTEGSLKSQIQLVLLYSTVLAMVLLSLVAIFLSAASICSEIDRKHIQITDTKPIRRWQFLLGKWVGVVVLCTTVMFAMTTVACALVLSLVRAPDTRRMARLEADKAMAEYHEVLNEVLVARRTVRSFPPPGLDRLIEEDMAVVERSPEGLPKKPREMQRLRKALRASALTKTLTAPPGGYVDFEFAGLNPDNDNPLYVRFHGFSGISSTRLLGRWVVWRWQTVLDEEGRERRVPQAIISRQAPEFGWHSDVQREFIIQSSFLGSDGQEFRVVPEDGAMFLRYENLDDQASVSFHGRKRVEIMQAEGSFVANYYRSLLIVLCHIALLAALGLMAGSIFSFPVATLTVVFFFVVGLVGPWFVSFTEDRGTATDTVMQEVVSMAWQGLAKGVLAVMPHFGTYSPLGDLTDGKMVAWKRVSYAGAMMVYVKGLVALLVGMYFYTRRELARVIV